MKKQPVVDVGKYGSLLWQDYDFQHPCSSHSRPTNRSSKT